MADTKKRSRSTSSGKPGLPEVLRQDSRAWGLVKLAIRKAWQWSKEYKDLINSADYTCNNCGTRVTNKANLYVEHLKPLEMQGIETAESYWVAMRDKNNIAVWGKACCKARKDKADKARIKAYKLRF